MPITNGYATLQEVKDELGIADNTEDTQLERNIEAASRVIDGVKAPLVFYTTSGDEVFQAHFADELHITKPCVSVSAVAIDSGGDWSYATTLPTADYVTEGSPIHTIRLNPSAANRFPLAARGVRVTGVWGYSDSVPTAIQEACVMIAKRLYKRKDAVLGVLGSTPVKNAEIQYAKNDPDIMLLLNSVQYAEVY
ncbi:MAG: phage head-tail connector protein [Chloroflexota bacterium]